MKNLVFVAIVLTLFILPLVQNQEGVNGNAAPGNQACLD